MSLNITLNGKVALVTGGASGIGEACARQLSHAGAKVVIADINEEGAARVADSITAAGGTASAIRADSSSPADNEAIVRHAVDTFGALHLAVNNAGVGADYGSHGDVDPKDWDKVIGINLNGVAYAMRFEIEQFLRQDNPGECAIVNMASIHGQVAALGAGPYTAAKHGVVGLTKNAGAEYGPQGIRINCVGPAYIDTPLLSDFSEDARAALVAKHPLGRLGRAEEIANVTTFLLSDLASFVTGAYWLIDGGYTAV